MAAESPGAAVGLHLLGHGIYSIIGIVVGSSSTALLRILPGLRLWRLSRPERLSIFASHSSTFDTGTYHRPATGIGQLRALAIVASGLRRTYRRVRLDAIYWSQEQMTGRYEDDIVLLGGPKNNALTRRALDVLRERAGIDQKDSVISWREANGTWRACTPVSQDHDVTSDYGLIMRVRNPFGGRSTLLIFSGGHTYGTTAAAKYFTERVSRLSYLARSWDVNFAAVVSCSVLKGDVGNITLVCEKAF